jgi:NADH-quinone oxidoreductase subunit L
MPDWIEKPGLLFVAATLLPILSFGLLFVAAALRWGLRPYAKDNGGANAVFQLLGGEVSGRGPAYVALGGIALAFLCSVIGFVWFLSEVHEMHDLEHQLIHAKTAHPDEHGHADGKKDAKKDTKAQKKGAKEFEKDLKTEKKESKNAKKDAMAEKHEEQKVDPQVRYNILKDHWTDSFAWARIYSTQTKDIDRGAILKLGFRIDMLAAVMFVMVTLVATLIHLFSIGYMSDELQETVEDHEVHTDKGHLQRRGRYGRFFMFLSLFSFSMLNLILTDNLFQIFVSWELVGICSYLLIGFYFERTSASNAANKAFIVNRVGDAGFIIGLLIIWTYFGTFNFQEIFTRIRCPEADSHGVVKVDGRNAAHQIIRGNIAPETGKSYSTITLDKEGDTALIFPRQTEGRHWHGPSSRTVASNEPRATEYSYIPYWLLVAAGLGIFMGCVGKSAQFPLQVWLPDAMEGPTPVSALIHAATMVAAGVYLVGRCYPLFTPEVLLTIAYVGAITLFVAATVAVVMTDIKKVLAYSTVSQLGYMMLSLGVGGWTAGLLHLLTHAFFKALLFLGSGSVIYGCHHQQDMLKMGGLYPKMKITAITMLIGVLAIAGIPLFSGWYSKDEILAGAFGFAMKNQQHFLLFLLPLVTAGITTFYMFRMWFMTFTGKPRDHHVYEHAQESPWTMTMPLIVLAVFSVCVAWPMPDSTGWPLLDADKSWLGHELHHYNQPEAVNVDFKSALASAQDNHTIIGLLALGVVGIGLAFASLLYYYGVLDPNEAKEQFPGVHRFLTCKWYFDELYSALIVRPGIIIAHWCRSFDANVIDGFVHLLARWNLFTSRWSGRFDKGIVDGFANLLADVSYGIGNWLRNVQTGYLRSYILFLALAAVGIWVLLYAWAAALGGG